MTKPLANRIALVTGASRGIGYALAAALARSGAHVVALARTVGGLNELDDAIKAEGGSATLVPCDLKDMEAIDRLGAVVNERWGRLDILVGNAGVLGKLTPLAHVEAKVWDEVISVNVTANWRLIRSMDPLLQASDAGRAVFVTSGAARNFLAYWGPYAVSKAALEAMANTYAAENATTSTNINLLNPGPVRTAMRAKAMPGEDPDTLCTPSQLASAALELCASRCTTNGAVYDFKEGQLVVRPK